MYVKQFNAQGELINPITKENPFVNKSVKATAKKNRLKNKMIIIKHGFSFFKYKVVLQRIGNKTIEHFQLV